MGKKLYKTIGDELQMSSFRDEFQKVYLNILFTANYLSMPVNKELKKFKLTSSQYNVLRILKGQKGHPISTVDIQSRMIYPNSNVSRILEKMTAKELIECRACQENRRKNNVFISDKGIKLLEETESLPLTIYGHIQHAISRAQAEEMNRILDELRNKVSDRIQ